MTAAPRDFSRLAAADLRYISRVGGLQSALQSGRVVVCNSRARVANSRVAQTARLIAAAVPVAIPVAIAAIAIPVAIVVPVPVLNPSREFHAFLRP